jgi:peptidoglycan-associated lipoprotein
MKIRFTLVFGALLALGCGSDPKPPAAAPQGGTDAPAAEAAARPTSKPAAASDKASDDPSRARVNISDEIRKACGISDSDAFFDFDSAKVRDSETGVLGKLATCFASGPLKGRVMSLIGHADPRGDAEYNMTLSGQRAENVKKFLGSKGLSADKVTVTPRGAMDATGTDETSWAKDRRVDVALQP